MTIRAVYFDLGGVIVRTEYQAPREHLAERLNLTYEDLSKIVFESESARKASLGEISTDEHWEAVARRLKQPVTEAPSIRTEFFAGDVVDRGLLSYIRTLRPGIKTGVISNAWPDLRDYIVENKFDDAFDNLIISAEVGVMKPDLKIYQLALKQFSVRADESAFVDDSAANVQAARSLGMHAILFQDSPQIQTELKALLG